MRVSGTEIAVSLMSPMRPAFHYLLLLSALSGGVRAAKAGSGPARIRRFTLRRPANPAMVAYLTDPNSWIRLEFKNVSGRTVQTWELHDGIPKGGGCEISPKYRGRSEAKWRF